MGSGRIYFHDSPWPQGHEIETLTWTGRVPPDKPDYMFFNLDLSASYYGEDPAWDDDDARSEASSWTAPGVWRNYNGCGITSWRGFVAATDSQPFDFQSTSLTYTVDPSPVLNPDDRVFTQYVLGHDTMADHQIRFIPGPEGFDVDWAGRVALTYMDESAPLDYTFHVRYSGLSFSGVHVDRSVEVSYRDDPIDGDLAMRWVERFTRNGGEWKVEEKSDKILSVVSDKTSSNQ